MPFNDEGLVRAIAASPVPVVTGIGHEPDTSIADMAADLRASTPTAAAEAVSGSAEALNHELDAMALRMTGALTRRLSAASARVAALAARPMFQDPMRLLDADARALDDLASRLLPSVPDRIARERAAVAVAAAHLGDLSPLGVVARGYAIARAEDGRVISSIDQVSEGSAIEVLVADGELTCQVEAARRVALSLEDMEA